LTLSDDLTWDKHIDRVCTNSLKSVNLLKRLYKQIPRETKLKIYKTFIRPKLEYADAIFDSCSEAKSKQLENVQRQAALVCSQAYRHTSHRLLLEDMGLELLATRRNCHKLVMFFKMVNNMTPEYLRNIVPQQVGHITNYNLRNVSDFRTPHSRTIRYRKSFLPSTIKAWNGLDNDTRNTRTLSNFKLTMKAKYFEKYDRLLLYGSSHEAINQARIRMGLSGLNQ
jgi:hypothetical protein